MKLFLVFFLAISFNSFSQTGSLTCDISFIWDDEDTIPVNVILTSQTETFRFYNVFKSDTLNNIKPGTYQAYFYCCDSTSMHGEVIEIEEGMITDVYYYDNFNYDVDRSNTIDSSRFEDQIFFMNGGYQFGKGIQNLDGTFNTRFNYNLGAFGGGDFKPVGWPFSLGFEFGIEYNHTGYVLTDFVDPSISYNAQRLININLSSGILFGVYVKKRKILDFGVAYHLPVRAKFVHSVDNIKVTARNIHNFNDLRLFAHVGYWWATIYVEYRTVKFTKSPYYTVPNLNLGIRLNFAAFMEEQR